MREAGTARSRAAPAEGSSLRGAGPSRPPAEGSILSRVAERTYWLGRYLERGDATGRLVTVNANLLMDLPMRVPLGWRPLIVITGSEAVFADLYGGGEAAGEAATERNVCRFLTSDARNPGAIVRSLAAARDNARNIRERMPSVTFEYINELYLFARSTLPAATSRTRRREALEGISRRVQQLEGFLSQNMLHDAHWEILRLGNHVERADMTTRIIDVRSADLFASHHELAPFADIQWRSVLRSAYAMQSYNASVRGPVTAPRALEFLFKDERLPRSYLRCLRSARRSLAALPRRRAPVRLCNAAIEMIETTDVGRLGEPSQAAALHDFIDKCQLRLGQLHNAIVSAYFDYS